MFNRLRMKLARRRDRDLSEEDAQRRQAELERRKAEAAMAERQQRIASTTDHFPGG
jgi:hypothetical protein